jgi:hypothetical protein
MLSNIEIAGLIFILLAFLFFLLTEIWQNYFSKYISFKIVISAFYALSALILQFIIINELIKFNLAFGIKSVLLLFIILFIVISPYLNIIIKSSFYLFKSVLKNADKIKHIT